MKYCNKHILEAINKGIRLALDDFEDIDDNSSVSSKQDIIDGGHFVEYARFKHIIKMLLYGDPSLPRKLDQIKVYKELIELHKKYGFKYKVTQIGDLKFIIEQFISIWKTTTNNFNWIDVSELTSLKYAFSIPSIRTDIGWVEIDEWDVSNVTDMNFFAWKCQHFKADLSKWNVSKVKSAEGAFLGCEEFTSDLSKWNTSNLEQAGSMFLYCKTFDSDLSQWNTSKLLNSSQMFKDCESFTSNLSKWNVENLVRCQLMFFNATFFKSDLSNWDLKNIIDREFCRQMFDKTIMEGGHNWYPPKYLKLNNIKKQ